MIDLIYELVLYKLDKASKNRNIIKPSILILGFVSILPISSNMKNQYLII